LGAVLGLQRPVARGVLRRDWSFKLVQIL
jgi:hypothetical protein